MSKYRNAYCSFCKKSFETVGPLVEGPTIDPRLHQLARKAIESNQPTLFTSISSLCEATALLRIVSGMLERIKAKGLNSEELVLLEDLTPKITQLRTWIDAKVDKAFEAWT